MDIQQNKELVSRGYQLFRSGDINGLLQLLSEDVEWIGNQIEHVPFAREYHGRQEVAQFFAELDKAEEIERFNLQELIAEDDKVVAVGQAKGTVRANGNSVEYPWVHVFTIREGKVIRLQEYFDTAAVQAAFMPSGAATRAGSGAGTTPLH